MLNLKERLRDYEMSGSVLLLVVIFLYIFARIVSATIADPIGSLNILATFSLVCIATGAVAVLFRVVAVIAGLVWASLVWLIKKLGGGNQ